jgi:cytochrome P450
MLMYMPVFPVTATRLAMRPFTFSNGMTVPAGTIVTLPASAIHTDERIYQNPDEFDGFRFAKLRESERDTVAGRHQMVSTSSEHLAFGIGRHIWYAFLFAAW